MSAKSDTTDYEAEATSLPRLALQGMYVSHRTEIDTLAGDIRRMKRCLAFFASVIKSGEPWTATCEAEFRKAMQL